MASYLLDSNVLSLLFKGENRDVLSEKIRNLLSSGNNVYMSGITYYEVKRGILAIGATNKLKLFDVFCEELGVVWLANKEIFDRAAEIYSNLKRKGKIINDADILIAALATTKDMTVVSDDKDFESIENLKLLKIDEWI